VKHVEVFTDGACLGNPGPGGYGIILRYGDRRKELSGGFRKTTNNRMELMGAIKALEALKEPCAVSLFSDSEYIVNSVTKGWALNWRRHGWRRKGGVVPNWDLWKRVLDLCERHDVTLGWVRGHAGHVENERCDELAVAAAKGPVLEIDVAYEHPPAP
jgi:ribonuclease HI